ncbi:MULTISPECIES: SDR family oxidoreductase [unclassified Sphingomonas]|uniref:SDR family oxidoreductase n=1 Tax=unclassified Sphingomonas TaxID=196159 RepID=UPI000BC688CA|nr:MAG: short-chain dehydrogenase [Sphingomonas sp. 12-62-6]OYX40372.1 MAG: short-chain dehydrogenase [Sphingomonas sp. 32-62-10]
MDLQGKTALVTGGTSGIGFATAKLFQQHGARVAITGQDDARLAAAHAELGRDSIALRLDVRSMADLAALNADVATIFGHLDIVFANAGVAFATPLGGTDEDRFDTVMDINVKGVFFTVQALLPLVRDGGSIILNTSWLADVGTAGLSALSASKAAVRSLARTWSREMLDRHIRVNAVSPGAMNTPIHGKTGMGPDDLAAFAARVQQGIPLGRFGEAQDVAEAALFLASDRSRYMLGAEIAVDGGFAQL